MPSDIRLSQLSLFLLFYHYYHIKKKKYYTIRFQLKLNISFCVRQPNLIKPFLEIEGILFSNSVSKFHAFNSYGSLEIRRHFDHNNRQLLDFIFRNILYDIFFLINKISKSKYIYIYLKSKYLTNRSSVFRIQFFVK